MTAEQLAEADGEGAQLQELLSRVSLHVVALVASAGLEHDPKRKNPDGSEVVRFEHDPFLQPEFADPPMWDLGAAFGAMDNARQGREPDSQLLMSSLLRRLPQDPKLRLNDQFLLYEVSRGVQRALEPHKRGPVSPATSSACAGVPMERFPLLVADIPLSWSLSPTAQRSLQCAAEHAADNRVKQLRDLQWHWIR